MCTIITLSPKCCERETVNMDRYACLYPEILQEYCKLRQRCFKMMTKRKRLCRLALPKQCRSKYKSPCLCMDQFRRKVSIYHLEEPRHTRTQQLSYPQPKRLLELKNQWAYQHTFPNERKEHINRLIRQSLFSMYSRLANVQPPQKKEKPKSFTKAEFDEYLKRLQATSDKHKSKHKGKGKKGGKAGKSSKLHKGGRSAGANALAKYGKAKNIGNPFDARRSSSLTEDIVSRRLLKLARPKRYIPEVSHAWQFTEKLKNFVPSPRLKEMARPRRHTEMQINLNPYNVQPSALHYKASTRINELAVPSKYSKKPLERTNVYEISRKALHGQPSPRIIDLAKPREHDEINIRSNPFAVSKKALKAKATKRIVEMALPRQYI